ncbi:pilin [bacterium]|nr:pilin [bacterium]
MPHIKNIFSFIFVFFALFFLLPDFTFAQEEFKFITNIGRESGGDFCLLLQQIYRLTIALISLLSVLMLVIAGLEYIMSAIPSAKTDAKQRIISASLGLLIAITAWITLEVINPSLVAGVLCKSLKPVTITSVGFPDAPPGTGGAAGAPSGGNCPTPNGGPCAIHNVGPKCSWNADDAAQVCWAESGGVATKESDSDRMADDRPFSIGLFQINLTVHEIGGLDCPSAFNGKNYDAVVINESLYLQCVTAAKNATTNINKACELYGQSGWQPWSGARVCGII